MKGAHSGMTAFVESVFKAIDCEDSAFLQKTAADPANGKAIYDAVTEYSLVTKQKYLEKGLPLDVYSDTMADIHIWADNFYREHGTEGLDEIGWIMNHLKLRLFAIGRLQFMPIRLRFPENMTPTGAKVSLSEGCNVLDLHIPQGKPLSVEACDASFSAATKFFETHFPKTEFEGYTCHSWLLSQNLSAFLPESSNILAFGKRFTITHTDDSDPQAEERIFGGKFGSNTSSSLAVAAKKYIENGGKIGAAFGVIETLYK